MRWRVWGICFLMSVGTLAAKQTEPHAHSLAKQATDVLTKLRQLQFESDFTTSNFGASSCSNIFYVKPILPIKKSCYFPLEQLIRMEFQIVSLPRSPLISASTHLGDTQFFDLFVVETEWGRWGAGPMFIFPTATKLSAGQGKWQVGPAVGFSYLTSQKFQFGLLVQNPIAFAGSSAVPFVNTLYVQPILTYHFEDNWYVESNPQWTFQWNKRNVQIPINLGVGKVFSLGRQKVNASLQGEWLLYKNSLSVVPQFTLQFSFNLLLF